jgi:hypothetical protein
MGHALYSNPQWSRLSALWSSFYPLRSVDAGQQRLLATLEDTMPAVATLIASHRPPLLGGKSLIDVLPIAERTPERLRQCHQMWRANPSGWRSASPTLAFAVIGQARADRVMSPEYEARLLADLLEYWALRTTIDMSEACAMRPARSRLRAARRPPAVNQSAVLGVA